MPVSVHWQVVLVVDVDVDVDVVVDAVVVTLVNIDPRRASLTGIAMMIDSDLDLIDCKRDGPRPL